MTALALRRRGGRIDALRAAARTDAAVARRRAALARVAPLWAVAAVVALATAPIRALRGADATDFVALDTGAWLVRHGEQAVLYTTPAQVEAQSAVVGHPLTLGLDAYGNPPPVAWMLQPLAGLHLTAALLVVSCLSIAAVALCALLLAGLVSPDLERRTRIALAVCCAAPLAFADAVAFGQLVPIAAVGVALSLVLLARRGDCITAGLALAPLGIKPQLVWLVVPVLLAGRHWRTVAGLVAAGAGWVVAGAAIVGLPGMVSYVRDVLPSSANDYSGRSAGLPGLLLDLGLPHDQAMLATVGSVSAALAAAWWSRRLLSADPATCLIAGLAASALCSPHIWAGDLAIAALGLALVARRRPEMAFTLIALAGVATVADQSLGSPYRFPALALLVVAAVVVRGGATPSTRALSGHSARSPVTAGNAAG